MSTPPGWYPVDGTFERWWDGDAWWPHTRLREGAPEVKGMSPGAITAIVIVAKVAPVVLVLLVMLVLGLTGSLQ